MPRALIPIYGVTFLSILGFTILIPLLPAVGEKYGASEAVTGTLLSVSALIAAFSAPVWGALSDRFGRKGSLLGSQALSFASYLILAFAGDLMVIYVSRVIEGFSSGNLGVANSYISDVTSEEQRPAAFAYASAAFGAGFIVGPILGGTLAGFGFRIPFFVAAGLQLANVIMTSTLLHETHVAKKSEQNFKWSRIRDAVASPGMPSVLWRQFLYIFAFTYFFTIFSLYVHDVLHQGPQTSAYLLGIAGVCGGLVTVFGVDRLVRRLGLRGVAILAFSVGIAAYILFGFVTTIALFVPAIVGWSISGAILRPTIGARLANVAPEGERGTLLGFSDSLDNTAMIFAPSIGATVAEFAPHLSGVLPAIALAIGLLLTVREKDRPLSSAPPATLAAT